MFEIASDISVERLKLIFPNEETRRNVLANEENYIQPDWRVRKITFDIEYLDKFKARFPDYEYELHHERVSFIKTIPKSFSVWGAIIERQVVEHQYFFSKLDEVES